MVADRLADALGEAQALRTDFPGHAAAVGHTVACLLALEGRTREAVNALAGLVDDGRWLSRRQLADPDLAALASHPAHDELTALMWSREQEATRAAHRRSPGVIVRGPHRPARAAVVVLHMHGVSGHETAAIWAPVVDADIAVAAVESTLRSGDGLPCWDDPALAQRDVHAGVEAARELGAPVVLAGGSQGAGVAARLALAGGSPILPGCCAWWAHPPPTAGSPGSRCRRSSCSAARTRWHPPGSAPSKPGFAPPGWTSRPWRSPGSSTSTPTTGASALLSW